MHIYTTVYHSKHLCMATTTSLQQPSSLFKTTYPLAIRIWHWLTAIVMVSTIIIVLLASTIFTTNDNVPMVQEQIQQKGGTVSPQQARAVAHEYSDKLWMLHKYIGFGLCFLLLVRVIIEAGYSREQKLSGKIKKVLSFQTQNTDEKGDRKHYLMVKWGYVIFYLLFLIMALTGLGLAFEDVPFFKNNHDLIEGTHSVVQYLIYFYILSHLVGVIRADLTNNKGIVSAMINGGLKQ